MGYGRVIVTSWRLGRLGLGRGGLDEEGLEEKGTEGLWTPCEQCGNGTINSVRTKEEDKLSFGFISIDGSRFIYLFLKREQISPRYLGDG